MSVIDGDEMSFRYTSINHNRQKDDVNDRPFKVLISLTRAKRVYSGLYIFTLIARLYILKKKNNLLNLTVNSFSRSIPTRFHRFDFAFMLYKLFATNLTGVSPACARARSRKIFSMLDWACWTLRVYHGLIFAERTVAAVMDGLGCPMW